MAERSHRSVFSATMAGILDRFGAQPDPIDLDDLARLDGAHVLITGASRGLGRGIAQHLGKLGAHLILPCRSLREETQREVAAATGAQVDTLPVDLSEPASVDALADTLRARGEPLSVVVLNAGVVPKASRTTTSGLDLMFHVNFLANVQLIARLLEDEVIRPTPAFPHPRIVVVGSEAHRSSDPIDFERFGTPGDYGTGQVLSHYGASKLHLHTWVVELSRQLEADESPVGVHHLCPGAVASEIAREAPPGLQAVLKPLMRWAFQAPTEAARPAVWLAAHGELPSRPSTYLHMRVKKSPSKQAMSREAGARLWTEAHALLHTIRQDKES